MHHSRCSAVSRLDVVEHSQVVHSLVRCLFDCYHISAGVWVCEVQDQGHCLVRTMAKLASWNRLQAEY